MKTPTSERNLMEQMRAHYASFSDLSELNDLRFFANFVPTIVWTTEPEGRIDFINRKWTDYTGQPSGNDPDLNWTSVIHPDDLDELQIRWAAALGAGATFEMEYRIKRASDGTYRWHEGRSVPLYDGSGRVRKWFGSATDIDPERAEEHHRFLAEASAVLASSLDYEETIDRVAHLAANTIVDWCVVDLLTDDGDLNRITVAHRDAEGEKIGRDWRSQFPMDPGFVQLAQSRRSLLIPRVHEGLFKRPDVYARILELHVRSIICVPLHVRERAIGILTLVTSDSRRALGEPELRVAEDLAHRASIAIENAELYRETAFERSRAESVFEQLPASISVTRGKDHYYALANPRSRWILGEGVRAIIGRTARDVFADMDADFSPAATLDQVMNTGETIARTNLPITARWPEAEERTTKYFDAVFQPVREADGGIGGVMTFAYEVTAQVRARELVMATEQRTSFLAEVSEVLASSIDYELTLERVANLAVPTIADTAGVYVLEGDESISQIAVRHRDPSREALIWELNKLLPLTLDQDRQLPNVMRTGKASILSTIPAPLRQDWNRVSRAEQILDALAIASYMAVPLIVQGRVFGAIALSTTSESGRTFSDDDLALAKELARRAAIAIENAKLYRAAQEANRLKDEFLATVSHELRTPLNAVLGWARILTTSKFDEATIAKGLVTIERNAKAQAKLVEDLLDMGRITSGKLVLNLRETELGQVVASTLESVRPMAANKGISLTSTVDPKCRPIFVDADRVQQIIFNLLTNGLKFTDAGGNVHVSVEDRAHTVRIEVKDDGRGIDREFLPHMFDRFRQADQSITRSFGGLGLGLAIVRHLVELHGGSVTAKSDGPGKGAMFTVLLPAKTSPGGIDAKAYAAQNTAKRGPSLDGLRLLVVDDDADAGELLAHVLGGEGADVQFVTSAKAALEALVTFMPDVLISDIGMPDVDGYTLLKKIRSLSSRISRVPAIALTAYVQPEERKKTLLAGFQLYLSKPVDVEELLAAVVMASGR
jgi:PAS domain S-box-containing protein